MKFEEGKFSSGVDRPDGDVEMFKPGNDTTGEGGSGRYAGKKQLGIVFDAVWCIIMLIYSTRVEILKFYDTEVNQHID